MLPSKQRITQNIFEQNARLVQNRRVRKTDLAYEEYFRTEHLARAEKFASPGRLNLPTLRRQKNSAYVDQCSTNNERTPMVRRMDGDKGNMKCNGNTYKAKWKTNGRRRRLSHARMIVALTSPGAIFQHYDMTGLARKYRRRRRHSNNVVT